MWDVALRVPAPRMEPPSLGGGKTPRVDAHTAVSASKPVQGFEVKFHPVTEFVDNGHHLGRL